MFHYRFPTTKHRLNQHRKDECRKCSAAIFLAGNCDYSIIMLHSERCTNKVDLSQSGPTIKFMQMMRKFITVHDTSKRVQRNVMQI